jgi:Lysozyme like domain
VRGRHSKVPLAVLAIILAICAAHLSGGAGGGGTTMTVTSATTCDGADGGGQGGLYDFAQLEQLWVNAGGPASAEQTAAAVGLAESGGCSTDLNTTDNGGTQTSWCLWQISNGTHSEPAADILNPAVCAQQAVAKYNGAGGSFSPWGTYTSGDYRRFMNG